MRFIAQEAGGRSITGYLIAALGIAAFVWVEVNVGLAAARFDLRMLALLLGGMFFVVFINRDPFQLLLPWLLLGFPLRSWGGIEMGMGIPNLTSDRIFLGFCLLIVVAQVAVRKRRLIPLNVADACLIFYIVISLFSLLLRARDLRVEGLNFATSVVLPLVAYFLARNLVRTEKEVRQVAWMLQLAALVISAWALTEQVSGINLLTGGAIVGIGPSAEIRRSSSGVGHPSGTGAALAMLLPFVLHNFDHSRRRLTRILALGQVGLLGIAVYFTYIRTAWLAVALVFIITAVLNPRLRLLCGTILVIGSLAVVLFWPAISESNVFLYKVSDPGNLYGRLDYSRYQWALFLDNPLFGQGGHAGFLRIMGISSHNTYLNLLAELGLVGFIPYVLPLFVALRQSLIAYRRLPAHRFVGQGLVVCLWCTVLAYTINALMVQTSGYAILISLYFIALALLMWMGEIAQSETGLQTINSFSA